MTPAFRFDRVSKSFGGRKVLDEFCCESAPGQIVTLLGENGAGKTTALRILLGLIDADSGSAEILGIDSRMEKSRVFQNVGFVSESPKLYEWMTVADIGWFAAGFYPDGYLDRFDRLTGQFRLPGMRRIGELSKGMRAKVALALAMAHEPALLVLDEPTAGLDPGVRREFLESMADVAVAGRTVMLASHQIEEVERIADCAVILKAGRHAASERLDEIEDHVRVLTVTMRNDSAPLPGFGSMILRTERRGRQWQLIVRDADENLSSILRRNPDVNLIDVRRPSLREIYVAHTQTGQEACDASDQVTCIEASSV